MKSIGNFLDTAAYWKVLLSGFILFSIIVFCFMYFMQSTMNVPELSNIIILKFSVVTGVFFGLMYTGMTHMARCSKKFWDRAKEIEALIKSAQTLDSLNSILRTEMAELRKLSGGSPHSYEVRRLYDIIITKSEFVK